MTQSKPTRTGTATHLPQYLIVGQGGIGLAVTNRLVDAGQQVTGLARHPRADYDLHQHAKYIQADALTLDVGVVRNFTHIAVIVTPDCYDADAYRDTYLAIAQHLAGMAATLPKLEQVVFISSTGVYGQDDGEWVDASTTPKPPSRAGSVYILQAEQALRQAFNDKAVIIRPSGIYGDARRSLIEQAKQSLNKTPSETHSEVQNKTKDCPQTTHWTNRIMDSDLVTVIVKVLTLAKPEPLYLASDYAPVSRAELMAWLRQQLATNDSPNAISQAKNLAQSPTQSHCKTMTGKRIHSNIPRAWLQYPDWQSGYAHLLKSDKALQNNKD